MNITWIGSPNYTQGRAAKIDRIVIHWMVGTLASCDATFQNPARKASAHYGIEDLKVHQYVKESDGAWHAGTALMNSRSIGLEHSAAPDRPASAQTIETSAQLVADICVRYGVPCDRTHIIKHSETPYATQCCGTIPIDTIVSRANEIIKGGQMEQVTNESCYNAFNGILMRPPTKADLNTYVGKWTLSGLIALLMEVQERAIVVNQWNVGRQALQDDWQGQLTNQVKPTPLPKGVYEVYE